MASSVLEDPDLECAICHEDFVEPKILPCTHLACKQCLLSWLGRDVADWGCPLCRTPIVNPGPGQVDLASVVGSLPTNLAIQALVDCQHVLASNHDCAMCQDGVAATAFCMQCEVKLCQQCKGYHQKLPATRNHQLEQLSNLTTKQLAQHYKLTCKAHSDKAAELFCPEHQLMICIICAATDHEGCKGKKNIGSIADDQKSALTQRVIDMKQHEIVLAEEIQGIRDKFQCIRNLNNKTFDELIQLVEETRQEMEKVVQAHEDKMAASLQLKETCRASLASNARTVEHLVTTAPQAALLGMVADLTSRLDQLQVQTTAAMTLTLQVPELLVNKKDLSQRIAGIIVTEDMDNDDEDSQKLRNLHKEHAHVARYGILVSTVDQCPWYHGVLSRNAAENLLASGVDGSFLVRLSEAGNMVLSARRLQETKHYLIHVCLSYKELFNSVEELIDKYSMDNDVMQPLLFPIHKCSETINSEDKSKPVEEIERTELVLKEMLSRGNFCDVYKALWKQHDTTVAVNAITGTTSLEDFQMTTSIMKKLKHPNIVQLMAVCTKNSPFYMVTEFMSKGTLHDYLRSNKEDIGSLALVSMAMQIASGMAFLEDSNVIHRDVATRTCLIADNNLVKLTDFHMARKVQGDSYSYTGPVEELIAIRWAAPEIKESRIFTSKSDVWAFGVLLWELATYGSDPYPGVDNKDVHELLKKGQRLDCPSDVPADVCSIMLKCWESNPGDRQTFKDIHSALENFYKIHAVSAEAADELTKVQHDKSTDENLNLKNEAITKTSQDAGLYSTPEQIQETGRKSKKACILVIGRSGSGKSTLGNSLLGRESFLVGLGLKPTTMTSSVADSSNPAGYDFKVVDTPDISDRSLTFDDRRGEIMRWMDLTDNNPSAILLAIRCDVRYSPEEFKVYSQVKLHIGSSLVTSRLIVAFTFGDRLDAPIDDVKDASAELQEVLQDAGDRYVVFSSPTRSGALKESILLFGKLLDGLAKTRPACGLPERPKSADDGSKEELPLRGRAAVQSATMDNPVHLGTSALSAMAGETLPNKKGTVTRLTRPQKHPEKCALM